jgi:hypothetical protein
MGCNLCTDEDASQARRKKRAEANGSIGGDGGDTFQGIPMAFTASDANPRRRGKEAALTTQQKEAADKKKRTGVAMPEVTATPGGGVAARGDPSTTPMDGDDSLEEASGNKHRGGHRRSTGKSSFDGRKSSNTGSIDAGAGGGMFSDLPAPEKPATPKDATPTDGDGKGGAAQHANDDAMKKAAAMMKGGAGGRSPHQGRGGLAKQESGGFEQKKKSQKQFFFMNE